MVNGMLNNNDVDLLVPSIPMLRRLFPRWFVMCYNTHRQKDLALRGRHGTAKLLDLWKLYVTQGGRCAQTLIPMTLSCDDNFKPYRCSVDRIDNSLPHDKGNIQLVIRAYNTSKAGRDDYGIHESVLTNFRNAYRQRPLDKYLLENVDYLYDELHGLESADYE